MNTVLRIHLILLATGAANGQVNLYQYPQQQYPSYGNYYGEAFRRINPYFVRQYRSAQDFYAYSKQELDRKVQDATDLLSEIRRNMNEMVMDARSRGDTVLQNALYRIDAASQDVLNFQRQLMMDRQTPFQQMEADWQNRISALYDNGLYAIMRVADIASGTRPIYSGAFLWVSMLATVVIIMGFL